MRVSPLVLAGLLASCTKTPTPTPTPTPAPVPQLTLFERLAKEGEEKDKADPPTSKVIAALGAAGVKLGEPKPQAAGSMGARFCVMFDGAEHVTVSICEFSDPGSAQLAAASSRAALKQISGRTVDVKRSTVLAIIDSQADAASGVVTRKARTAFEAL